MTSGGAAARSSSNSLSGHRKSCSVMTIPSSPALIAACTNSKGSVSASGECRRVCMCRSNFITSPNYEGTPRHVPGRSYCTGRGALLLRQHEFEHVVVVGLHFEPQLGLAVVLARNVVVEGVRSHHLVVALHLLVEDLH